MVQQQKQRESYNADLVKGAGEEGSQNAVPVYQALLFGDAYYGIATALSVELRDNGVEGGLRKKEKSWLVLNLWYRFAPR